MSGSSSGGQVTVDQESVVGSISHSAKNLDLRHINKVKVCGTVMAEHQKVAYIQARS